MSSLPSVGFIGLGIMGKPMAHNLMRAGYAVTVLNRSRGPVDELVAEGARAGSSPRDVAASSEIIITMLPDSPDVESVVFGTDGVASGIRAGALFIDMSTIAPATARSIAQRLGESGVDVLDAPVSGGEKGAIDAALSIMIGGTDAAFARAEPIFRALGKNIVHVGPAGRRSGRGARRVTRRLRAEQDPRSARSAHDRSRIYPRLQSASPS
jgi:2-hydroxy-3-oxopropionate reductase